MNFVDRENWDNVEELERQYQQDQLTVALVGELHEKLKQYFLRRTKEILDLPHKVNLALIV
jgi:chromodomain-helicase-DNA-binding protein 4